MHPTIRFNNSTNESQSEILGGMMWVEMGMEGVRKLGPKTSIVKN